MMSVKDALAGAGNEVLVNRVKDGSLGFIGDVINFSGEIHFKSMLRIDGKFSGQVNSPEGTLIISSSGQVTEAVINVAHAIIQGTVSGKITASKQLELGRTARVTGNIAAGSLIMEAGAIFDGNCTMGKDKTA